MSDTDGSKHQVSESGVLLFTTDNEVVMGSQMGRDVVVYKVHVDNGMSIFYATVINETAAPHIHRIGPPWGLGLDKSTFLRIQSEVANMISVELRPWSAGQNQM